MFCPEKITLNDDIMDQDKPEAHGHHQGNDNRHLECGPGKFSGGLPFS
jgi:hypothetical protein